MTSARRTLPHHFHPLGRLLAPVLAILSLGACAGSTQQPRPLTAPPLSRPVTDDQAAFETPRIEAVLDAHTASRRIDGNAFRLLVNGSASFARRFENARNADLILVKTFIFSDDETGRAVADLLSERARAGATVILQYDIKGSVGGMADVKEMLAHAGPGVPFGEKAIIRRMREAGVRIVATNPPGRRLELERWGRDLDELFRHPLITLEARLKSFRIMGFFDHEKYWITGKRLEDGRVDLAAIMGGMNIASEYAYGGTPRVDAVSGRGGWRDTDVEARGPIVNAIVERFFDVMEYHLKLPRDEEIRKTWNVPQPTVGNVSARFVFNHPRRKQTRALQRLYRVLIDAAPAGSMIRLETAYFAPGKELRGTLERAMDRGVTVEVLSNSEKTNDITVVSDASRYIYFKLLEHSPRFRLYERIPRPDIGESTLHSKVASFGWRGPIVVGSFNLDAQSGEHNSESVLVIYGGTIRPAFDAMFLQDIAPDRAVRITRETFAGVSTWTRLKQGVLQTLGWYWL